MLSYRCVCVEVAGAAECFWNANVFQKCSTVTNCDTIVVRFCGEVAVLGDEVP